jgi:hypothetical protein
MRGKAKKETTNAEIDEEKLSKLKSKDTQPLKCDDDDNDDNNDNDDDDVLEKGQRARRRKRKKRQGRRVKQ